jgi:predicted RNA binding protein YcfA (HicA-like mRNA interferase family)
VSSRECVAALARLGFQRVRAEADRVWLERAGRSVAVPTVPTVPTDDTLPPDTLADILESAGVAPVKFVEALEACPTAGRPDAALPMRAPNLHGRAGSARSPTR